MFAQFTRDKILKEVPDLEDRKMVIIPHAVNLENAPHPFVEGLKLSGTEFLFLVPAGIRPVKNVLFCLRPLAALKEKYPFLRLIYAGPVLENAYGEQFLKAIGNLDWVIYLGAVPHEKMLGLFNLVDVVINSSVSEGMPNAILEAMSLGKAVLVSKIPGNEAIVSDGIDGFVFSSESDFYSKAERLLQDRDLRKKLGDAAKKRIDLNFPKDQEIQNHIRVYREAIQAYFSTESQSS